MFSKAYELAKNFTQPVIISTRKFSGEVNCSIGSFIILNPEGWIVTAAHIVQVLPLYQRHQKEIADYKGRIDEIEKNPRLKAKQKKRQLSKIKATPDWLTNFSFWWGADGIQVSHFKVLGGADIGIGRIDHFQADSVSNYPVLKDPSTLPIGTSLCKLGFPFHNAQATFDEKTGKFSLAAGTLPVPRFPIEGIYTRNMITGKSRDGKYEFLFLETSSPGLRGQSGGPVFDTNATIWGVQSRTHHYPLGFSPKVKRGGKEVEENQFLNVGLAVHPKTLIQFLTDNGVTFKISDY